MSGDWLAFGALGVLVAAGAIQRRRGSRAGGGAPALRLVTQPWDETETDLDLIGGGTAFGGFPIYFDPDETGTPARPQWSAPAVRRCPFGHARQQCRCELRQGYWPQTSKPSKRRPQQLGPSLEQWGQEAFEERGWRGSSNEAIEIVRIEPKRVGFAPRQMMKAASRGRPHDPNRVESVVVTLSHSDPNVLLSQIARTKAIVAAALHLHGARYASGVSSVYRSPRSDTFHIRYEVS